jgi:hypothetical protein
MDMYCLQPWHGYSSNMRAPDDIVMSGVYLGSMKERIYVPLEYTVLLSKLGFSNDVFCYLNAVRYILFYVISSALSISVQTW